MPPVLLHQWNLWKENKPSSKVCTYLFLQQNQPTTSITPSSSLFVTPLPPSSNTATHRKNSRNKKRSKGNIRPRERTRNRTRNKSNNRNARLKQPKQYPDKRQHLDKLFEIAGQTQKNEQLNKLLEIAGKRPPRQISSAEGSKQDEPTFR